MLQIPSILIAPCVSTEELKQTFSFQVQSPDSWLDFLFGIRIPNVDSRRITGELNFTLNWK